MNKQFYGLSFACETCGTLGTINGFGITDEGTPVVSVLCVPCQVSTLVVPDIEKAVKDIKSLEKPDASGYTEQDKRFLKAVRIAA